MPMLEYPTRYRPRNPNVRVSPAVLTPPDDDVPAAFNPSAIDTQDQYDPPISPRPDAIPTPPKLDDTQASAALDDPGPINPDVATKSAMPAFARNNGPVMPPPGTAPAIQPAANAPVPPANPPASPSPGPASGDVAKQALADVATQEKSLASGKAPEAPKSNLAQRLGLAVLSMTKLAPHANQIIHPKWSEEEAAYERGQKDINEKLKGAETSLSAAALGEQREATAEQKRGQAQSYDINAENRAQANRDRIAAQTSAHNKKFLEDQLKGRESDALYQSASATKPPDWQFIEDPDKPGFGFAVPPAWRAAPQELLPYLPGSKAGDMISHQEFKSASDAANKANLERTKAEVKPDRPITNEYQGILQEFTDPKTGLVDYAKANAEWDKRQTQRTLAGRAPKEPNEAKAKDTAINAAFAASGNDWNKVLEGVRAGKFPDHAADIADHAQKMVALPSAQQRVVSAADTTVEQVQRAIDAIDEATKAHPDLVGGVAAHPWNASKRKFETWSGTEPPDIGAVDSVLETAAALQPGQHNFRSIGALADFKKSLGIDPRTGKADGSRAWLINPEKTKAALKSVAEFNQRLKENTLKNSGRQPAGTPGAAQPLQYLHTDGKTTIGWNGTQWVQAPTQ